MEAAPTRSEALRSISGPSVKTRPANLAGRVRVSNAPRINAIANRYHCGFGIESGASLWKIHVLVGRKSMTPVGEVIATANGLGEFKDRGSSGVLPNQKRGLFSFLEV